MAYAPHREISKDTTWSLRFKNKELEEKYVQQRESMSSIPLVASFLVLIIGNVYSSIILPSTIYHFLLIAAPIILIVPIICISIAESFPMVCWVVNSQEKLEREKRNKKKTLDDMQYNFHHSVDGHFFMPCLFAWFRVSCCRRLRRYSPTHLWGSADDSMTSQFYDELLPSCQLELLER